MRRNLAIALVAVLLVAVGAGGALAVRAALGARAASGARGVVACNTDLDRCWQQGDRVQRPRDGCRLGDGRLSRWQRGSDFPTDPYYSTFACADIGSGPQ
jgi:hypothetical protein